MTAAICGSTVTRSVAPVLFSTRENAAIDAENAIGTIGLFASRST